MEKANEVHQDRWRIFDSYFAQVTVVRYYPVNLDILNRDCLVVGGGSVAERKVETLLECGAKVVVVTRHATSALQGLASKGLIDLKLRTYQPSDLEGRWLVFCATDDDETNQMIAHDAARQGTLCNVADRPEACSFVLPAVVRQGDLLIAVSTSNKSPAVSRRIRQRLEKEFGSEYAVLLNLMGAIRKKLQAEEKNPEGHKKKFERLLDGGLLQMIHEGRSRDINALFKEVLGKGYTWKELMATE